MNNGVEAVVTIASGIIGLAIVAVLVSNKAQTGSVLGAAGSAFANALSAATGPVTGKASAPVNAISTGFAMPSFNNLALPG